MDRYWDTISSIEARVLVVGPTALRTIYGAVVSIDIDFSKKKFMDGVGGLQHVVVAVQYLLKHTTL